MQNNLVQSFRCLGCGCSSYSIAFDASDFDTGSQSFSIALCRDCGLAQTIPVDESILAKAYSGEYYGSGKAKFVSVLERLLQLGHRFQAKKILKLHRGLSTGGKSIRVLDIGCGRGLLLQSFQHSKVACVGLERDEFPVSEDPGFTLLTGALSDPHLNNEIFDIIIIWHALEHILAAPDLLRELGNHLNRAGMVVISVPNFSSWQSRWFRQHWFHLDLPRHVIHFNRDWLVNALQQQHFTLIKQSTFSASQNIYGFLQSSLNSLVPSRPNRLYALLKHRSEKRDWLALAAWSCLALILVPIAILETLLAEIFGQGAALTLYFRYAIGDNADD